MPFNMSDKRLVEFSDQHLNYEIYSLCFAVELFAKQLVDPKNFLTLCARNLFLEGIIIHSRCIYEFLYFTESKNPRRMDDALAIHYFDSADTWERIRPAVSKHFKELHERAGKEVVHLTYTRLGKTELEKKWDFRSLVKELLQALQLFVDNADSNKLHPRVKSDLAFWRGRVGPLFISSFVKSK